jgi:hypothetical protein
MRITGGMVWLVVPLLLGTATGVVAGPHDEQRREVERAWQARQDKVRSVRLHPLSGKTHQHAWYDYLEHADFSRRTQSL